MAYLTGDIPVGDYSSSNLANIGIGHGAIDGGVGYTYFDPKNGHEFSAVLGLTGNFKNTSTDYTSGIDAAFGLGSIAIPDQTIASRPGRLFLRSAHRRQRLRPILCPFESRVIGVGPQIGYLFPVGDMQGYLNLKGYKEFDNFDRPDGYNLWLTFVLSPKAPAAVVPRPPILTK